MLLSRVWFFVTTWTVVCQAPVSIEFSRPEYWNELPFPSPGGLPDPGMEPWSPALQVDALPSEPPGKGPWRGDSIWETGFFRWLCSTQNALVSWIYLILTTAADKPNLTQMERMLKKKKIHFLMWKQGPGASVGGWRSHGWWGMEGGQVEALSGIL